MQMVNTKNFKVLIQYPTVAMDDYMSVSTYQDMALTTVKQLGQGHFGVVELCSHDNSSNSVPHRSELVAVKRFAKTSALDFSKAIKPAR